MYKRVRIGYALYGVACVERCFAGVEFGEEATIVPCLASFARPRFRLETAPSIGIPVGRAANKSERIRSAPNEKERAAVACVALAADYRRAASPQSHITND